MNSKLFFSFLGMLGIIIGVGTLRNMQAVYQEEEPSMRSSSSGDEKTQTSSYSHEGSPYDESFVHEDFGAQTLGNRLLHIIESEKYDLDRIKKLIADGAAVDTKNDKGQTSLHLLVRSPDITPEDIALLTLLLKSKANPNNQDENGQTPMHYAAAHPTGRVLGYLLTPDAQLNIKDKQGKTPGHIAAAQNNVSGLKLLIGKNAHIDAQDQLGNSLLHHAAYDSSKDNRETIVFLIENGLDKNIKNRSGQTPAHFAIMRGNERALRVLLDQKVDMNAADKNGMSLLFYTILFEQPQALERLLEYGADILKKNNNGQTVIDFARTRVRSQSGASKKTIEHMIDMIAQSKQARTAAAAA